MNEHLELLNDLFVDTFNAILKVEEQSLRSATDSAVTVTEMHTLDAIGADETRTISELAAALHITVSTMTIGVSRLQAKGLVERVRDDADRRVVRVHLTSRGRVIARAHQRFHRRMAQAVLDTLSPEQTDVLIPALENLRDFFARENDKAYAKEFEGIQSAQL